MEYAHLGMEPDLHTIQVRQREIAAEIERLRAEAAELEIALRVFERFSNPPSKANGGRSRAGAKSGASRPEGVPSLFEMTETVIHDAIEAGKPGLKSREIVAAIGNRYWPGVTPSQVLPPIYAFAKKGRLLKTKDGIFSLSRKNKDGN
jgi:hypothetical protein